MLKKKQLPKLMSPAINLEAKETKMKKQSKG
jgi:hypothetical protein